MKEYVVGLGFTQAGNVWLVRKNKQGVPSGWNGIGGKIESGDASPAAAMAREWREETCVKWPDDARDVATLEGGA